MLFFTVFPFDGWMDGWAQTGGMNLDRDLDVDEEIRTKLTFSCRAEYATGTDKNWGLKSHIFFTETFDFFRYMDI